MVYLHLILANSKFKVNTKFKCYLVNGDRQSKYYLAHSKYQGQGHSQFDCEKLYKTESLCISLYVSVYAASSCLLLCKAIDVSHGSH